MSPGKVICVMNRKGGVGKTTLAVALADTVVSERNESTRVFRPNPTPESATSVALVDLDPQGSATRVIMQDEAYLKLVSGADPEGRIELSGLYDGPDREQEDRLERVVLRMQHRITARGHVDMALVGNCERSWSVERDIDRGVIAARTEALLESLRKRYAYVLVDTPPGYSHASETAARCADLVVCPVTPDRLAQWGMDVLHAYLSGLGTPKTAAPPHRFLISAAQMNRREAHLFEASLNANNGALRKQMLASTAEDVRGDIPLAKFTRAERVRERIQVANPRELSGLYGQTASNELRAILIAIDGVIANKRTSK